MTKIARIMNTTRMVLADLRGGARDARPQRSQFFQFHAVSFWKKIKIMDVLLNDIL